MNIGVILAAGKSSRFDNSIPKQLFPINHKPVINYSIDLLSETLDEVIIVTNSDCFSKIETDKKILINDIDNRIESIKTALNYLEEKDYSNILIHDAARPFITKDDILRLIDSQNNHQHSQYFLPLVNGLAKRNESGFWEIPNRDDFIQLCSPQITDFQIFNKIFNDYILTGLECEILPVASRLQLRYNLIKGNFNHLRKITTTDDL